MRKKITILIILAFVTAVVFLIWKKYGKELEEIKETVDVVLDDVKKEISTPSPLRATKESELAYLTRGGVIKWTNAHRANAGLAVLSEDPQLNTAARLKVEDMFARQYFEHVSPTGGNIATLLDGVGYQYITVGENLALGNYENDQMLVQAWMDSPGHRANILNGRFQEIGVAVAQGVFEGRKTWLAVQAFGLPLSACPQPDATLKAGINIIELQITDLKRQADVVLGELEEYRHKEDRGGYNQKVKEYNALVEQINNLIAQLKNLIAQYNMQVASFNICASK